jgi:nitroreductase
MRAAARSCAKTAAKTRIPQNAHRNSRIATTTAVQSAVKDLQTPSRTAFPARRMASQKVDKEPARTVSDAVSRRMSTRAFLRDKDVSEANVREILAKSLRAPSGGNTQPWHLYVVKGDAKEQLSRAVIDTIQRNGTVKDTGEYTMYPTEDQEPNPAPKSFIQRRRALGFAMYNLMGIDRKDKAGRMNALFQNYEFFGAPVGIIVTVERSVDRNGWGHVGTLLQNICLLAEEQGLSTCLQEAWGNQDRAVYDQLEIPDNEVVWCGVALGYADPDAAVNTLRSEREPVDDVVKFFGFSKL